jgi:superfamily I DNA/RNA helicase
MFPVRFPFRETLTEDELKLIRYYLFPEVRISARQEEEPVVYEEQILFSLRDVKVMDLHQENLAKALGDKHRLLRGVAGSGKTLVLACRAKYLAQRYPDWKILVLCYNISLASFIRQIIDEIDIKTRCEIEVDNFHHWCYKTWGLLDEAMLDELLLHIENGDAECPKYDAILIDEGQDFEPSWLRLIYHALNPDTHSLLLVEDRAQQIYHRKTLSQELGISFQGRSKILTINYRNTEEIITFAWDFYQHFSQGSRTSSKDDLVEIIPPKSANRHGPLPVIKKFKDFNQEARFICNEIQRLHDEEELEYEDIAILYRVKKYDIDYIEVLKKALDKQKIPYYWLAESNASKRQFKRREQGVKLTTVESSKGLEFKAVFICNVENFPFPLAEDIQREVSLLYIAITRAVDRLYLTHCGQSVFTDYLDGLASDMMISNSE